MKFHVASRGPLLTLASQQGCHVKIVTIKFFFFYNKIIKNFPGSLGFINQHLRPIFS